MENQCIPFLGLDLQTEPLMRMSYHRFIALVVFNSIQLNFIC